MFYGINEVAVLVTAILAIAIGSIWYSPIVFGKIWMKAVGFGESDIEESKKKMPKLLVGAVVANVLAAYALAYLILIVPREAISLLSLSVWLTVLVSGLLTASAIWEQKPFSYILIMIGYTAIVIIGGMHVIGLWPW